MAILRIIFILILSIIPAWSFLAYSQEAGQSLLPDRDSIASMSDSQIMSLAESAKGIYSEIPMLERVLKISSLSDAEKERYGFLLEMARKNSPGSIVPDFKFIDSNGNKRTLHEAANGQKTILLFYDPDCDTCHEVINRLKTMDLPDDVRIIAIDAEEDTDTWRQNINMLPEEWTVGFATDPIQDTDLYIFMEMPTIYLIGKDLKIILKDATIPQIISQK